MSILNNVEKKTLSYKNHQAINSSADMIGLIEGAGRDMFENKKARNTASYINRQFADSLTILTLGHKVSEVAKSKKTFKEFYNVYGDESFIKANQPKGLAGHIVIEDNMLH